MVKKTLKILGLAFLLFLLFYLFYDGGKNYAETKIATGHGPEDLALDISEPSSPRIFISCSKRKGDNPYGKIQSYDVKSGVVTDMQLIDYDQSNLRPHGIFLLDQDSIQFLYVISHENGGENEIIDKIIKFQVEREALLFTGQVWDSREYDLFDATNDLHVLDDGTIYCTNPTSKVDPSGVPAKVVVIYPDRRSAVAAQGLKYPNGVYVDQNMLYVATAQGNNLYKYKLKADGTADESSKAIVAEIPGGDNIIRSGDDLLIAHHPSVYKFMFHNWFGLKSPSAVTSVNINTEDAKIIYGPSAKDISASSTGLIHDSHLYIAQVFEPYIIKVPLSELN